MAFKYKKESFQIVIFVALYVLLGNARSVQENPLVPGAVIAVNMVIPVLAGVMYGRGQGLMVGFLGTLLNAFSPAGSAFELAAIIPHACMGFLAGYFKDKAPTPIVACTLFVGHLLNIIIFVLVGLLSISLVADSQFWLGILYETFIGIVTIMLLKGIITLGRVRS
tara:strand:- start:309 stop:806 length:498 start_codon:yes stop_codon:yes gene_type:complete